MATWYPDSNMTFYQYLTQKSFTADIVWNINSVGENIADKLDSGFGQVGEGFGELSTSIDAMSSKFDYNMGLLLEQVSIQNDTLSNLVNLLDSIHNTLKSPLLTEAREFFKIGSDRLQKGLLDKALEAFLRAEKINDTDFFTQYRIGKLYLYGVDEDDNVLDYKKAVDHLLMAARYAKAEIKTNNKFTKLAAESYFNASIALYAQLGEPENRGDNEKSKQLLLQAKNYATEATKLNDNFSQAFFHVAKYSALLEQKEDALNYLEVAIIKDPNYISSLESDGAFLLINKEIPTLITKLATDEKSTALQKLNQLKILYNKFSDLKPEDSGSEYILKIIPKIKNAFTKMEELCREGDYRSLIKSIALYHKIDLRLTKAIAIREDEIKQNKRVKEIFERLSLIRRKINSFRYMQRSITRFDEELKEVREKYENRYLSEIEEADINDLFGKLRTLIEGEITDLKIELLKIENSKKYTKQYISENKFIQKTIFYTCCGLIGIIVLFSLRNQDMFINYISFFVVLLSVGAIIYEIIIRSSLLDEIKLLNDNIRAAEFIQKETFEY